MASLLKGIPVKLINKVPVETPTQETQTEPAAEPVVVRDAFNRIVSVEPPAIERDDFNRPVTQDVETTVDNVLVAPLSQTGDEIIDELSLNGKKVKYQMAIPKGDTHSWEDAEVEFFGVRWKTIGFSTIGIEDMIPLDWNRKVLVERVE